VVVGDDSTVDGRPSHPRQRALASFSKYLLQCWNAEDDDDELGDHLRPVLVVVASNHSGWPVVHLPYGLETNRGPCQRADPNQGVPRTARYPDLVDHHWS